MFMLCDVAVSKSNKVPSATVTTPLLVSIAKRPPALSLNAYVTVVPASASVPSAVTPTVEPVAEFSATTFVTALLSTRTTGLSFTLHKLIVNVSVWIEPSLLVAVMLMLCDVAVFKI